MHPYTHTHTHTHTLVHVDMLYCYIFQISPVLQVEVWSTLGKVPSLLDVVLNLFVSEMKAVDSQSSKSEMLAATCTSIAAVNRELLATSVIKRMFKV